MPNEGQSLTHDSPLILNGGFFASPSWTWVEAGAVLLVTIYLTLLLPRLKAGIGLFITGILMTALLLAQLILTLQQGSPAPLVVPATILLLGHAALATGRHLLAKRREEKTVPTGENNRGAKLQSRSRQPLDMSGTGVPQSAGGRRADIGKGMLHKSKRFMLGRYLVTKELGKGAMGLVYLGEDAGTGHPVAIKTMALSREFEKENLAEVKDRLFSEAETAGQLHHPNIVTIFGAGEAHDLAYIAMEYLKGKDLAPYTNPDHLLPAARVMDIVASVADALDYAHGHQVVHRDIKPANIMYEPDTGAVKVTDFGIARITDSSRTKSGMVLGTPSYMSPEQLSGRSIDGRSDLFSLGVMLFQMLTGQLPFQADSMVALTFRISSQPHQNILAFKPELPQCLSDIVDRMLEKDVEKRYQRGMEIATDLRNCMRLSYDLLQPEQMPR